MFYSHEVLTSRKYGVATVWLVATLGQRSIARKVSRRAILDVDVSRACETVITPEMPMALRLQSSLLYGISRVYSQQCGYVLADAQHAQAAIRTLIKVVHSAHVDSGAAKARTEQITLRDDPSFVPTFSFGPFHSDLLDLKIGATGHQRGMTDSASLHTTQSQHLRPAGLQLPSSSSPDIGDIHIPGSGSHGPRLSSLLVREEDDILLPEIDIGIDADGNFIDFENVPFGHGRESGGLLMLSTTMRSTAHQTGQRDHDGHAGANDDLPLLDDSYAVLPRVGLSSSTYDAQQDLLDDTIDITIAAAPQRQRARAPKVIPVDKNIELRNRDLLAMNSDYLQRMLVDWKRISALKNSAQAKRNAHYWLLGRGIATSGDMVKFGSIEGPLAKTWSGDNLYLMLTGQIRAHSGKKRDHETEETELERRVRPHLDNDEPVFGNGDDTVMRDYELEIGREGQPLIEDPSSAMPWNVSASMRGSSVARSLASAPGVPGSVTGSLTRRGSRTVIASPPIGHGPFSGRVAAESLASDAPGFNELDAIINETRYGLHGMSIDKHPQATGQFQELRGTLGSESNNFLDFLCNALHEKHAAASMTREVIDISFEELLPPESNTRIVAAQAFLQVLILGTKYLVGVTQKQPFSDIALEVL